MRFLKHCTRLQNGKVYHGSVCICIAPCTSTWRSTPRNTRFAAGPGVLSNFQAHLRGSLVATPPAVRTLESAPRRAARSLVCATSRPQPASAVPSAFRSLQTRCTARPNPHHPVSFRQRRRTRTCCPTGGRAWTSGGSGPTGGARGATSWRLPRRRSSRHATSPPRTPTTTPSSRWAPAFVSETSRNIRSQPTRVTRTAGPVSHTLSRLVLRGARRFVEGTARQKACLSQLWVLLQNWTRIALSISHVSSLGGVIQDTAVTHAQRPCLRSSAINPYNVGSGTSNLASSLSCCRRRWKRSLATRRRCGRAEHATATAVASGAAKPGCRVRLGPPRQHPVGACLCACHRRRVLLPTCIAGSI